MNKFQFVTNYLLENNLTISTAESITGGLIAGRLVDCPGISKAFHRGYVTYSEEAKTEMIGVNGNIIRTFGAVSAECARKMAIGAKKEADSDIAIASTGLAGPDGNYRDPIGTVYLGLAMGKYVMTRKYRFHGNRQIIRRMTVNAAIDFLYDAIKRINP